MQVYAVPYRMTNRVGQPLGEDEVLVEAEEDAEAYNFAVFLGEEGVIGAGAAGLEVGEPYEVDTPVDGFYSHNDLLRRVARAGIRDEEDPAVVEELKSELKRLEGATI